MFSPIASDTTIRVFLTLCALLSLYVNQIDVEYVFVSTDLESDAEMRCKRLPGTNVAREKHALLKKML